MTIELIKQLLDACYLAKRAREMLPALPEGVTSSYIQCLDVIQKLQTRGIQPKISDLSDTCLLYTSLRESWPQRLYNDNQEVAPNEQII